LPSDAPGSSQRQETAVVSHAHEGVVEFRMYHQGAGRVDVVGTFTGWQAMPVRMQRDPDGWWSARVSVTVGEHRFAYLVDGQNYLADFAAHGVERDRFGGLVSVLAVDPAVAA
jgi:1,4-alpha-glucan branching enzyme